MMASARNRDSVEHAADPAAADLLRELVGLQRVANEHLTAIRRHLEEEYDDDRAMAEPAPEPINKPEPAPELIDKNEVLTPQQAAGIAERDVRTIRRRIEDGRIATTVAGGARWILRTPLMAYLARRSWQG
jgi:hypothetical protein